MKYFLCQYGVNLQFNRDSFHPQLINFRKTLTKYQKYILCVCVCGYIYICIYIYIYTHTDIHTHIHTYVDTHTYTYTYTYECVGHTEIVLRKVRYITVDKLETSE